MKEFKLNLKDFEFIERYYTTPNDDFCYKQTLNFGTSIPEKIDIPKDNTNTSFRQVYSYTTETKVFFRIINDIFADNIKLNKYTFAYKKGTSIGSALRVVENFMKDQSISYFIKTDIHSYFNSVPVDYICNTIVPELFDGDESIEFIRKAFRNTKCYYKGEIVNEDMGIQPGNPFSSFLANYVLENIDRRMADKVKEVDGIYLRYSDDILVGTHRPIGLDYIDNLQSELKDIGLTLSDTKTILYANELTFLGIVFDKYGNTHLTENKLKSFKSVVKHACKMAWYPHLPKDSTFEDRVKEAYKVFITKIFDGMIFDDRSAGLGGFIINNISNDAEHEALNNYLIDHFKVLKTGKHNKNTAKKTTLKELRDIGFLDWKTIRERFLKNKYFFINDLYSMAYERPEPYIYENENYKDPSIESQLHYENIDAYDFISALLESVRKNYMINGASAKTLWIDIFNGDIRLENKYIVKDFRLLKKDFIISSGEESRSLTVTDDKISLDTKYLDEEYLFDLYLGYSYRRNKSYKVNRQPRLIRPIGNREETKWLLSVYSDRQRDQMFLLYLFGFYKNLFTNNKKYRIIKNHDNKSTYICLPNPDNKEIAKGK